MQADILGYQAWGREVHTLVKSRKCKDTRQNVGSALQLCLLASSAEVHLRCPDWTGCLSVLMRPLLLLLALVRRQTHGAKWAHEGGNSPCKLQVNHFAPLLPAPMPSTQRHQSIASPGSCCKLQQSLSGLCCFAPARLSAAAFFQHRLRIRGAALHK